MELQIILLSFSILIGIYLLYSLCNVQQHLNRFVDVILKKLQTPANRELNHNKRLITRHNLSHLRQ